MKRNKLFGKGRDFGVSTTQCGSQPKTFWGKYFEFKRVTIFGLGHRVSKHKTTRHTRNLG